MDTGELIALIEGAFPAHPISEVTLRQRTLTDQGMSRDISDEEWESAGRVDRDVPWTMLSDNDLLECEEGVAHLWGPELAYYLGALLRFSVRHLDAGISTREWSLVHSVLFRVTDNHADRRDFEREWAWLNADQIGAVRTSLEHVAVRSERFRKDARRALDRYWNEAQPVESDYCPVCAYALPLPPKGENSPRTDMCHCCGIRFGIDDVAGGHLVRGAIYRYWRAQWFSAGMPWRSGDIPRPEGWTPAAQLERLRRKE